MNTLKFFFFEVKVRFFYLILAFFLNFVLLYSSQIEIVYLIGRPFFAFQHTFIFTDLTEAFSSIVRVSLSMTFFTILPLFLYHFWSFLIPSFYMCERYLVTRNFLGVLGFYFFEIYMIYALFLPKICGFLLSFEMISPTTFSWDKGFGDDTESLGSGLGLPLLLEIGVRIQSYLELLEKIFCFLLLFFQIPFLCIYFLKTKRVHSYDLCRNRKNFLVIAFLASASISPPDFYSQFFLAFFLFFLYEICIFLGLFYLFLEKTNKIVLQK